MPTMHSPSEHTTARIIKSFLVAGSSTVIFIVLLTLGGEQLPPLKTWLAQVFSHHWLGKSFLSIIVFGVVVGVGYAVPGQTDEAAFNRWVRILAGCSIIGTVVLYGYFTLEWLHIL